MPDVEELTDEQLVTEFRRCIDSPDVDRSYRLALLTEGLSRPGVEITASSAFPSGDEG